MCLYFLGIAKTSYGSFILPQEAFFFHCPFLLERFTDGRLSYFMRLCIQKPAVNGLGRTALGVPAGDGFGHSLHSIRGISHGDT